MKLSVLSFKGETPIVSNRLLPDGYGSKVFNAKVVSGDLDSYPDIGNPFQLAKAAPINTVFKIGPEGPLLYLQFSQDEVNTAEGETNIDVSYGTIPGDTTYRTYITGNLYQYTQTGPVPDTSPQQTNKFYATDPSQQGSNTEGAYPYVTFDVGVNSPLTSPTVIPPVAAGQSTTFQYAAETTVNAIVPDARGTGYSIGDTILVGGGTYAPGFLIGASAIVTQVSSTGQVFGLTLLTGGFYTLGNGPPAAGATTTGGTGIGLTVNLTVVNNSFPPWSRPDHNNGAGYYATSNINGSGQWQLATGQGDVAVFSLQSPSTLNTATSFIYQADWAAQTNNPDLVIEFAGTFVEANPNNVLGPAVVLSVRDGTFILYSTMSGTNGGTVTGGIVDQVNYAAVHNTEYRITISATGQLLAGINTGFNVSVTLALQSAPNTPVANLSGFVDNNGEFIGIGQNQRDGSSGCDAIFENIQLVVTQAANSADAETTAYVYTYVTQKGTAPNAIEEESGPSNPSQTVTFYLQTNPYTGVVKQTPIIVTIPPAPANEDIAYYNIYRLAQQTDGTEVYQYVTQIAASTTMSETYSDSIPDAQLGADLVTADFVPPPADLEGILPLPNGIMAGFFANTLSLSAQNYPYAWPVANQLTTDYPIVAIAAVDTSVLVLTEAEPYTAWGNDPSAYNMSKETAPCGCVSKRSVATHRAAGAIYASGTGLWAYRGLGQLVNLTEGIFDRDQWNALNPSSIIGAVYDDFYFFWYQTLAGVKGGYFFDIRKAGAGLVAVDFHVTCVFLDPQIDALEFTPDFSLYPINGNVVAAAINVLSTWEVLGQPPRFRSWERDEYLLPRPATFMLCRVYADDYSSITLTISSEQGTAFSGTVTSALPFIMAPQPGRQWSMAASGTSRIRSIELVENAEELTPS